MKKIILNIVLAVLCLNFSSQAQNNKAVDVTTQGIQIGQKVPDLVLNNIHNYKSKTARLSDFKGKLLILDFWATWCAPCVSMIPKMDSLQKTMGDKIQFLSVTYQSEKEVIPFLNSLEKKKSAHYNIPVITSEKELHKVFPHIYLPHYIWIDGDGVVKAITGFEDVTAANISSALKPNNVVLNQKKDLKISYDRNRPLLVGNNGGNGDNLLYHSLLTSYTPGLESGISTFAPDAATGGRIVLRNLPLTWFYNVAFGKGREWMGRNRTILEVKQPAKIIPAEQGNDFETWLQSGNGFSYELIVPKFQADSIYFIMQDDLKRIFQQYVVRLENRKTKSMVLTCFDKSKLPLSNKGISADRLITTLNIGPFQEFHIPIVNGSGISGLLDLQVDGLDNMDELNQALEIYGLKFLEKEVAVEMLVYRDKPGSI